MLIYITDTLNVDIITSSTVHTCIRTLLSVYTSYTYSYPDVDLHVRVQSEKSDQRNISPAYNLPTHTYKHIPGTCIFTTHCKACGFLLCLHLFEMKDNILNSTKAENAANFDFQSFNDHFKTNIFCCLKYMHTHAHK